MMPFGAESGVSFSGLCGAPLSEEAFWMRRIVCSRLPLTHVSILVPATPLVLFNVEEVELFILLFTQLESLRSLAESSRSIQDLCTSDLEVVASS